MAIAVDTNTVAEEESGATSLTFSHTCTGSNLVLIVATVSSGSADPTGVTYNGVAMTKAVGLGAALDTSLWYLSNPATSAHNVVVTYAASTKFGVCATSFTGCNTDSPLGVTGTNTGTSGTASCTVTSQKNNSMMVDATFVNGVPSITVGASQTAVMNAQNAGDNFTELSSYKAQATAGSVTMSYTFTSTSWTMAVMELRGDFSATISDTLSLSDTITAGRAYDATVSDTLTLSDSNTRLYGAVATISDTLTLSDIIDAVSDLLWEPRTRPSSPSWTTTGTSPSNSWLQNNDWHYVYTGIKTPLDDGWTASTAFFAKSTRFTETATGGVYRAQLSGVATDEILDYLYPQTGSIDFATGVTLEWYAKYAVSDTTGAAQSNMYIGDDNQVIRVLYTDTGITVRRSSGSIIYTDSATTISTYHKYKLVILGDTVDYYVDDVLLSSGTDGTTGSATNYVRLLQRCSGSASTYDVSYQYIRVRRGAPTDTITSWTLRS